MKTPEDICPDFPEWPARWHGAEQDIPYGHALLEIMRSFVAHLIEAQLTEKTIKKHMDNLWLLGAEVIREVSNNNQYDVPPLAALLECIDSSGGPYSRHIDSEWEQNAFDATCRRFFKFLNSVDGRSFHATECRGCDTFSRVDDIGLCEECAGNWKYGKDLEIIAPDVPKRPATKGRKKSVR